MTEEFYCHNGLHGTREDVVFLVNGIPVLVIECKNATKDEAIALGVDQVRRYHAETPELFVPEMVFTATEAIGFSYGVTWNLIRRNIFNWKHEQKGNLEAKVKSFCDRDHILTLLKDYILFAEKDEELQKFILRQRQKTAVERVVERCLSAPPRTEARRGLVWHTQGSGKTFTMIKAAEKLFKAAAADKPTVLVLIDRNELEDQMLRNLAALGLNNVQHADRIATLNRLLKDDYRGIIVSTIHKFQGMAENLNTRSNIFVLIDEAHRTTGGDLGNYLVAGVPNAVTKVINLIKSIEQKAEEESGDPFLIAMAERAKQIQENYEDRQTTTREAMDELFAEIRRNEERKQEQAEKGYDSLRYFVFTLLQEAGVKEADGVSANVAMAFVEHPNWRQSEADLRELRKAVTFAVYAQVDDLDEVTGLVDRLFSLLAKAT